jgi:inorganic pyrophosphatase
MNPTNNFLSYRPHPWHGVDPRTSTPEIVNVYVEITPFDMIKYEVDKNTGFLWANRPQYSSSAPPAVYGFIPRTYCGEQIQKLSPKSVKGDGDPLDIMVVSERPFNRNDVFLQAKIIGGFKMVDHNEADDKIVAVLVNDTVWSKVNELKELPEVLVKRMWHYFVTYKLIPGEPSKTFIERQYGRKHAMEVVSASIEDYNRMFSEILAEEK